MTINNSLKKGTLLDVYVSGKAIILKGEVGCMDITVHLSPEEITAVLTLGKALALVIDESTINLILCVNYHSHSQYSILDGMSRVKDIAKKSSGVTAITEHGNMYSLLEWQTEMKKLGKKPIFGCEVYSESISGEKQSNHLVLLARNEIGKANLFALVSDAYGNFYKKPHVSYDALRAHADGLICTSACIGGEISQNILKGDILGAERVARWFQEVFGEDFYLEIQRHNIPEEDVVNPQILSLGKNLGIKVLCANDSHYIDESDTQAHEMLLCINTKSSMKDPNHYRFDGDGYHFYSDLEMFERFKDVPECVSNTLELARKCTLEIETGVYHFPKFDIPQGFASQDEYFSYLAYEGYKQRFGCNEEYRARLEYEINTIISMGFAGYFLIVWDYIRFAKENGIYVGPGRGSAVGSLVCYCLQITDLNPIRYELLFERFLNPERISMPDIDTDFEYERRGEVIEYVKKKYGEECVSRIVTFGNMKAKSVLKDASRTLYGDYRLGDELSKLIPAGTDMPLKDAVEIPEFATLVDSSSEAKDIYESALKIEGNKRQTGVHACGVIIADAPVKKYMPTVIAKNKDEDAQTVTQLELVEDMGLLKMDFLGLKNMSVIANTFRGMNLRRLQEGISPIVQWRDIPLNNPYVYIPISHGDCHAIFQIEGEGMRKFMKELFADVEDKIKAIENRFGLRGFEFIEGEGDKDGFFQVMQNLGDEFFDRMIAGISLYRPGPMEYIPDYIKGMNNPSEIVYDAPMLEPILKSTYGVIVYQEQVMQIVRELAGFSMPQADHIRKAMSKKKQYILDEYKPYFLYGSGDALDDNGNLLQIKGCVANGVPADIAERIWNKMEDFAKYAFNKSHAAGYAVITITCAWLKYYYADLYMAAQLNAYVDNTDKLKGYLSVTKNLGVTILPPDINMSMEGFVVEDYMMIRFGFSGLSGLSKTISSLVAERELNGLFTSFSQMIERLLPVRINKKGFNALILSGSCDSFENTRRSMAECLDEAVKNLKAVIKKREESRDLLFAIDDSFEPVSFSLCTCEEYSTAEKLDFERSIAGCYLSGNPIDEYSSFINKIGCSEIGLFDFELERTCTFAGIITDVRQLRTKNGNKPMANIMIEDRSGEVSVVIFNKVFENCFEHLEADAIVVVKGKPNVDPIYGTQVIAESVIPITTLVASSVSSVMIRIENNRLSELDEMLTNYVSSQDSVPVWCYTETGWTQKAFVKASSPLFLKLQNVFGANNVAYR